MPNLDELVRRLKDCRGPFPYRDMVTLLGRFGYRLMTRGKTGGSRRKFYNPQTKAVIFMHAPHGKELKPYAVRDVREHLEGRGLI
jgi:hypothetical protein